MTEGYDGIIKDINYQDTDMPAIMFNSQKNLGKISWKPRKINNKDYLEMLFSIQTGKKAWDELYKKYVGK